MDGGESECFCTETYVDACLNCKIPYSVDVGDIDKCLVTCNNMSTVLSSSQGQTSSIDSSPRHVLLHTHLRDGVVDLLLVLAERFLGVALTAAAVVVDLPLGAAAFGATRVTMANTLVKCSVASTALVARSSVSE